MLRIHVGRVLAVVLCIIGALMVIAAMRSPPAGEPDGMAAAAALAAEPRNGTAPTSSFKGHVWCSGLVQTQEADAADACTAAIVLVNLFGLFCCFLALAIICDDFLVPPIEHFCERYQIPDEAAGASFLAFGSSAPEIVIASIATLGGADPEGAEGSETGLSTVLGSAVLAFGLIPAVSALLSPPPGTSRRRSPRSAATQRKLHQDEWEEQNPTLPPELARGGLLLEMRPLVRDVSFAVIGFAMICESSNGRPRSHLAMLSDADRRCEQFSSEPTASSCAGRRWCSWPASSSTWPWYSYAHSHAPAHLLHSED